MTLREMRILAYAITITIITAFMLIEKWDRNEPDPAPQPVSPIQSVFHSTMIYKKPTPRMLASCGDYRWKHESRDLPVWEGTDRYTHYLRSRDCNGFDEISKLRLRIHHGAGNCGGVVPQFLYTRVRGWRLNPNVIGNWNPTTWTVECKASQPNDTYVTTRTHTTFIFASMSRDDRCMGTHVVVDWQAKNDQEVDIPALCYDGR